MAKPKAESTTSERALTTRAEVPAHLAALVGKDKRGQENIGTDFRPPALRLAQGTTKEIKRAESVYIDGLTEGEFFNSTTREIYGEGPLEIVVINPLGHRHIQFAPMAEGGGVIDFNVKDGDPRTEFTEMEKDGKMVRVKPVATKFFDYLILILREGQANELATMSLKGMQLKKGVQLNSHIKLSGLPAFAQKFRLTAVPETKSSFTYYGWRIDTAGYCDEALFATAEGFYEQMKTKKIEVEVDADDVERPDSAPNAEL